MSEPTKRQIGALKKKYAYLIRAVDKYGTKGRVLAAGNWKGEGGPDLSEEETDVAILLSALSTAERERDEAKQFRKNVEIHFEMLCTDEIRAHAFADVTHDLDFQVFRVLGGYREALDEIKTLKAQVVELEARLQGAADRGVAWQKKLCKADDWSCENCTECADLRTAIVGKKEG